MKTTGIVRKIDELGRLSIPKELRRVLDINEKDPVEIFVEGETIILRKYLPFGKCAVTGAETIDNETIAGVTLSPEGKAKLKAALK